MNRSLCFDNWGSIQHPTKSNTIDGSGMDAEPQDAARELIHDDQDPVSPQRGRFASEQIYTPEAVLELTNEGQPGWPPGGRLRFPFTFFRMRLHLALDVC